MLLHAESQHIATTARSRALTSCGSFVAAALRFGRHAPHFCWCTAQLNSYDAKAGCKGLAVKLRLEDILAAPLYNGCSGHLAQLIGAVPQLVCAGLVSWARLCAQ